MVEILIKKLHADAVVPEQGHDTDAGYDLVAVGEPRFEIENDIKQGCKYLKYIEYRTGLSVQPPTGYHLEITPRSSISKYGLMMANPPAIIDEGYRGEILLRFKPVMTATTDGLPIFTNFYKKGDKVAQMILRKTERITFKEVDELDNTPRGEGGFGSTDKKI